MRLGRRISTVLVTIAVVGGVAAGPAGATGRAAAPSVTCPGNPVTVTASMMAVLQSYVSACPGGTEFDLPAGNFYRFATIVALTGDRFIGKGSGSGGTVLHGSRVLPASHWTASGGDWVNSVDVTMDSRTIAANDDETGKACADPYYPQGTSSPGVCDYPDLLYLDDAWLTRVLGTSPTAPCPSSLVTTGTYCIDYAAKKIVLGTDPSGHSVTYSGDDGTGHLLQFAFVRAGTTKGGQPFKLAQNVTLKDLAVTQYANTDPITIPVTPVGGAVIQTTNGWVVDGVQISQNHGCGISFGGVGPTLSNSVVTANGKSGYCGSSTDGTIGPNTSVTYNNQDFFNIVWGAGGGKMSGEGPLTVTNSSFSYNNGNGLWFDGGYHNVTITGSTMAGNKYFPAGGINGGDGIRIEISCFITVTKNTVTGNQRVGINLDDSHDVTIGGVSAGNTLSGSGVAEVRVNSNARSGSNFCKPLSAKNDKVANNTITMSSADAVGVVVDGACSGCISGTSYSGNVYKGGQCSAALWKWWNGSQKVVAFSVWKSTYGQDTTGSCS